MNRPIMLNSIIAQARSDAGLDRYELQILAEFYPELFPIFDLLDDLQTTIEQAEEAQARAIEDALNRAEIALESVGELISESLLYFSEDDDGETMGLEREDSEAIWPKLIEARRLCEDAL